MFREVLQDRTLGLRAGFMVRSALAAMIAAFTLGAAATSASAAATLNVSDSSDLRSGMAIDVSGDEFLPPTPPSGYPGMYVTVTASVGGQVVVDRSSGATRWIRYSDDPNPIPAGEKVLDPSTGEFPAGSITVNSKLRDSDGNVAADCKVTQCFVSAVQAHVEVDPDVYASVPIEFEDKSRVLMVAPRISPAMASSIRIAGFDFDIADSPDGFRVAQAQLVGGQYRYGNSLLVVAGADPSNPSEVELTSNGNFLASLGIEPTMDGTGGPINCELGGCSIIVWPEGQEPIGGGTSNLFEEEAISFDFDYDPTAALDPEGELDGDTEVKVTGEGFPPGQPGVYISQIATVDGKIVTPPAGPGGSAGGETKYVRPNGPTADQTLNSDGSFETSINVEESFTTAEGQEVDCKVADCAVATWRAHTDPTRRSLYTVERLRFKMTEPGLAPAANVVNQMTFRTGRKPRKLNLVAVRCGSEDCAIAKSKRAFVRVGKRKVAVRVTGPNRVAAGERAVFGVVINRRVIRQLTNRKGVLRFGVAARSATGNERALVGKVLVGPRHRR